MGVLIQAIQTIPLGRTTRQVVATEAGFSAVRTGARKAAR